MNPAAEIELGIEANLTPPRYDEVVKLSILLGVGVQDRCDRRLELLWARQLAGPLVERATGRSSRTV